MKFLFPKHLNIQSWINQAVFFFEFIGSPVQEIVLFPMNYVIPTKTAAIRYLVNRMETYHSTDVER